MDIIKNNIMQDGDEADFELLIHKIFYHAAPAIMGYKPSNLICFVNSKHSKLKDAWFKYRHRLNVVLPIRHFELVEREGCVLVLFYRASWLEKIISKKSHQRYFEQHGLLAFNRLDDFLVSLADKFKDQCPHEVGIALGYPLSDVIAFEEKKEECLYVGYWKVYSDVEKAKRQFALFDKAKEYLNQAIITSPTLEHLLNVV